VTFSFRACEPFKFTSAKSNFMHFLKQNFVIDGIEGLSQIAKYGNFFFLLPWKQNSSYGLLDAFAKWAFLKPFWSGVIRCRHSEIQYLLKRYVFCNPDCSTAVQKCLNNYNNINIYYTIYKIKIYQNLKLYFRTINNYEWFQWHSGVFTFKQATQSLFCLKTI
jgi:hypothetical protein